MKTVVFLLATSAIWAQPLRVYSEFAQIETRPDATGKVIAPAEPREILSPAIVRNGFSSFQIVVDVPQRTTYQLYVAQNPENSVAVTLYRENGDKLEPVDQPVSGDRTQVFWIDLWTAGDAPVQRIKVEPQLHVNNDWVIYPIEGRVMDATVPDKRPEGNPPVLCNAPKLVPESETSSPTGLRSRNARQDVRLAATAPPGELQRLFPACQPKPGDPEWYLRIRDYLLCLR